MERNKSQYNLLLVGDAGTGKSALAKQLTGDQRIVTKGGMDSVTKNISYYKCMGQTASKWGQKINVIDTPGLNKIQDRFSYRQQLSKIITENKKIQIDAILYVVDVRKRNFIQPQKIINFIKQLPWENDKLKSKIIPIITYYDHLLQNQPQQINEILEKLKTLFVKNKFQNAWQRHIFFVACQKQINIKKIIYPQLQNQLMNQIQLLIKKLKTFSKALDYSGIQQYQLKQREYVKYNIIQMWKNNKFQTKPVSTFYQVQIIINKNVQNSKISTALGVSAGLAVGGALVSGAAIAVTKTAVSLAIKAKILAVATTKVLTITCFSCSIGAVVLIGCYALYKRKKSKQSNQILAKISQFPNHAITMESISNKGNTSVDFSTTNYYIDQINNQIKTYLNKFVSSIKATPFQNKMIVEYSVPSQKSLINFYKIGFKFNNSFEQFKQDKMKKQFSIDDLPNSSNQILKIQIDILRYSQKSIIKDIQTLLIEFSQKQ